MERVICGIDRIEKYSYLFSKKRIGLVTSPAGYDVHMRSSVDIFMEKYDLRAVFSPEFGLYGDRKAGENVSTFVDDRIGICVYGIYGGTDRPVPGMLNDIDVLVFDVQNTGVRYSSFPWTLLACMQSCAKEGKAFVVLDRPNPLGGIQVEGCRPEILDDEKYLSYGIPQRYALTIGELAFFLNNEKKVGCDVHVVPMEHYRREMLFEDTGLVYLPATPNLPTPEAALLYAGTGMLEKTALSVGLGTSAPYQQVGAPWLDGYELARRLNEKGMEGILFRPVRFFPSQGRYRERRCYGVQLHLSDKRKARPTQAALHLLGEAFSMAPESVNFFSPEKEQSARIKFDYTVGTSRVRTSVKDIDYLVRMFALDTEQFEKEKQKYHIYE